MRRRLADLGWRLSGYRLIGQPLPDGPAIIIGAPHTSNWDFAAFLGVMWTRGRSMKVLVKKSWFRPPIGWGLRALGGIPVDRDNPAGIVDELASRVRHRTASGQLVMAPEGTRSRGTYWKSGFYRLALAADLPVTLASIDAGRREVEIGPTLRMTGDVHSDMDRIRAFYADKAGIHPDRRTEPRLRAEDVAEDAADGEPNR